MARNIVVEDLKSLAVMDREIEIVERKGLGHPDSVADGIAESVSRALSRYYIDHFGRILHHNTDETQVVGGQAAPKFGGGVMLEPIYILLVGRATTKVNGERGEERIPYRTIAVSAAREYLKKNFRNLNTDEDVLIDCRIGQGSQDLRELYDPTKLLANDTSFGVGFAPFTETEKLTYETERYLNGELHNRYKEIGEDIKVMGFRQGKTINLTIAQAFVDKYIPDKAHYLNVKEELKEKILDYSKKFTEKDVRVYINTADNPEKNLFYLTVTGLSFENGDDGSVGRGNRVNGLITPYRPMSMEAAAGKNPVTHVGKLYNILAFRIANDIYEEAKGDVKEVHVRIVSQIGRKIDDPHVASIQVIPSQGVNISKYEREFKDIADRHLASITKLKEEILEGKVQVF
ncbi:MAG: methionine adenosyltransferase [Thermoplasmata archaeon]|jgi:S-adenosylmethionine synthetase|nr:methionine adenosyltransferase [Thermoplasmata archaeon]MVT13259.1 methionine adenosyltransferase [Euryarchaeota archaeon]MVT14740.1 methionine adenosyltransferase [Euryarchaeota archaeon]MVT35980.1 methionine adenosyltransferase [Euryarchaeota archaeon]